MGNDQDIQHSDLSDPWSRQDHQALLDRGRDPFHPLSSLAFVVAVVAAAVPPNPFLLNAVYLV